MELISPKYSFVKFNSPEPENNCCTGNQIFCIPLIQNTDLFFQFDIQGADLTEGDSIFDVPLEDIQLILLKGNANTEATVPANTLINWTADNALTFEKYRTAINVVTYQWRNIMQNITDLLKCDECFQLAVKATISEGNVLVGISNCCIRKCDDCYTSVIEYYNDEDYAEFKYCNIDTPVNRVRLPIYLTEPKPIEDKGIYRKSNGSIKQSRSLLTKEYLVLTEHFPEHIHDKLTVALAHDYVSVATETYNGGISKNGDYAIEWTDNICTAPANFKATATPYAIRNSNCADCKEVDVTGGTCVAVGYPGDPMPDAFVGLPYYYSFILSGDPPFVMVNIVDKPDWMTINLAGSKVIFSGTPTATADNVPVIFTITNCDGAHTLNFSQTVDVTDECHTVTIPDTTLPDAVVSVPYTAHIILGGDAPFTLNIVDKPAWMTITVAGNTITLSGTPPTVATGLSIIFNVSNCGGTFSQGFIDSIDVAEGGGTCHGPVEIIILNIGSNSAEFSWTVPGTYPSGGYEWEVFQGVTSISSGNYIDPPHTDLLITGLNPSTDYHIKIRANCGGGDFSGWVDKTFTTTS